MSWDFYFTKSIDASASQKRTAKDYGLKFLPWKNMCIAAGLDESNIKILIANSINKKLENMDLVIEKGKGNEKRNKQIDIDSPRIVCLSPFTIADEEIPKAKVSEAESVLMHIRNAFAHGNTYYFDNKYVLLEDKDQRGGITAKILMSQQTLIDLIRLIDHESRYYTIVNVHQDEEVN